MKRRVAAQSPEILVSQYGNAGKLSIHPHTKKRALASQTTKREDSFSAKNWVKTTSSKENSIEKVIGESVSGKGLAARIIESLQKGVPYTFAATKNGSKFSIRPDTDDVIKRFIEEKSLPAKKEKV
ncbi:MAG: hypothetical protein EOP45_17660 [Sphingobacteriaceae bacterium]|nr:MAG: hypothetical protein EOP45_17660 [Sphingobacteriaceae bacterium]